MEDVDTVAAFFKKEGVEAKPFILNTWEILKSDAKARKADPREPMERLFDQLKAAQLFPTLTEEQINQRLIAWFAQ
jgi:deoxyribonuclease-4